MFTKTDLNTHTLMHNNSLFIPSDKILSEGSKGIVSPRTLTQFVAELASYGYVIDDKLKNKLAHVEQDYLVKTRSQILETLYALKGGTEPLVPLFGRFPHDVPDAQQYFATRVMSAFESMFQFQTEYRVKLSCGCSVNKKYFDFESFNKCPVCQCHAEELYNENSEDGKAVQMLNSGDKATPITLTHADEDDVREMMMDIIQTTTSVTKSSKLFLIDALDQLNTTSLIDIARCTIPFKEILCVVSFFVINKSGFDNEFKLNILSKNVNSANDVLRIAYTNNEHNQYVSQFTFLNHMNRSIEYNSTMFHDTIENDNHMNRNTRFKFSNSSRKVLLGLLNQVNEPLEDMKSQREQWLRIGEYLHPNSKKFKNRFPNAQQAFNAIRNTHKDIKTFNGEINDYFEQLKSESQSLNNVVSIAEKAFAETFTKRPGVMVRSMDRILRETYNAVNRVGQPMETDIYGLILDTLKGHYDNISYRALISARDHFSKRKDGIEYRVFSPAKSSRKFITKNELQSLDETICDRAIQCLEDMIYMKIRDSEDNASLNDFVENGKGKGSMKVCIDPELYNRKMPIYLRDAKESIYVMETYSSIDIDPNYDVVRSFVYWNENKDSQGCDKQTSGERVDIDLSVNLSSINYTGERNIIDSCSYMNLQGIGITGLIHSGDIQEGPGAEFIDISIKSALNNGATHAIAFINSYTGQTFDNYYCFGGVMFRKYMDDTEDRRTKGKQFDINTVHNKFDITGEYNSTIPYVIDFKNRKMIVVNYNQALKACSNVETNVNSESVFLKHAVSCERNNMSIGRYMELYAQAKGHTITTDTDDCDVIIGKRVVGHVNEFSNKWMV